MKKNFLEEIKKAETLSELKAVYKNWCMKLHPDLNPDKDTTEEMKALNNAYEEHFKLLKTREMNKDKKDREKFSYAETPEDLINIINTLIRFKGLQIDIVGNWIWLSGNTYPYKEEIKNLKFHWSKNKKKWFWNGSERVRRPFKKYSYNDIKSKYGCITIKGQDQKELAGAY